MIVGSAQRQMRMLRSKRHCGWPEIVWNHPTFPPLQQRYLVSSSTSSHAKSNGKVNYRTNGGLVEGVWIFCRHGDRTPGRILSPAHKVYEEGTFWTSRLPFPNTQTAFAAFSEIFPPQIYPGTNHGQFMDAKRNPYGFLTQKGISQLKENGHRYFNRYNQCARHLPERNHWRWEHAQDFLAVWDVQVYSTNYMRTILSAQSFLDGLLGTHCYTPSQERSIDRPPKELSVPDHKWVQENFGHSHNNNSNHDNHDSPHRQQLVPVQVRQLSQDPLNAFDRNPDAMAEFVGEVMKCKEFHARDSAAAPLGARLANIMPGLIRPHRSDFSSRSPSGINWVEAADHFICRESHDMPLSSFSDFENDDRVEQTLKAMSLQTKVHLAWRFRQWYQNKSLLAAISAPPLREMWNQMAHTISHSLATPNEKRPFTLYSCHDITILGLLYGIGASFFAEETVVGWDYWPPYATTLVFELVRTDNAQTENEFVIRILVLDTDGEVTHTVECVDYADKSFLKRGTGVDGMMRMEDLEQLIVEHEVAGGDCAKL